MPYTLLGPRPSRNLVKEEARTRAGQAKLGGGPPGAEGITQAQTPDVTSSRRADGVEWDVTFDDDPRVSLLFKSFRAEGAEFDQVRLFLIQPTAAAAGVQCGDLIIALNGISVENFAGANGAIDQVEIRKRIAAAERAERPLSITFLGQREGRRRSSSHEADSCSCRSCGMLCYCRSCSVFSSRQGCPWCLEDRDWTSSFSVR